MTADSMQITPVLPTISNRSCFRLRYAAVMIQHLKIRQWFAYFDVMRLSFGILDGKQYITRRQPLWQFFLTKDSSESS